MTGGIDAVAEWARGHLENWDRQQASYINRREDRFAVMLDALAEAVPDDALVVDLACGPGSISDRVLRRFPRMKCVAVDYDPMLLELGRLALAEHGDRVTFREADLWDPTWIEALGGRRPHAVLSSTALHWLPADVLSRVYRDVGEQLHPGGVLMNADHLRQLEGRPLFEELSRRDDAATQARDQASGALTWDTWFSRIADHPHFAPLCSERERRFANRPPNPDLSVVFHVAAMRAAQFREAGPIWQHLDDFVILAQR